MSDQEYLRLQDSPDTWSCKRCLSEALPYHCSSNVPSPTRLSQPPQSKPMQVPPPSSHNLNILYTNCRSVLPKIDELRCLASQHSPHIICLCETWLDDTILDCELNIPSFSIVRRDRCRNGGGIAIYIHESITFKVVSSHVHLELLTIQLNLPSKSLTCCLFYRPPSSTTSVLTDLEDTLDALPPSKTTNLLVLGDFNIDVSNGTGNHTLSSIQDLCEIICRPTRLSKTTSTLIDHVYLSDPLSYSLSFFSPLSSSDHCCILLSLSTLKPPRPKPSKRKIWVYQQADFETATDKLANYHLDDSLPIDSIWSKWSSHFMSIMTEEVPSKLVKRSNSIPYLTPELLKLIRKKHCLFKLAAASGADHAWSKFRTIRNHTTSALRSARRIFLDSLTKKLNSPSDFWKSFHKLIPKKSRIPVDLSSGSETSSSPISKANLLNRFFASCFTCPSSTKSHLNHVSNISTLENITVHEPDVQKLLSQHKTNTATGPDGISGHMLQNTSSGISTNLTKIFNLSLYHQKVPSNWKISHVNPIPKGKDIHLCSNYRPISLLSLPSKILERVVHSHISKFLAANKLLSNVQFGFRPRSSTQEALLSITNSWHSSLTKHKQIAAVFIDVKKAFDSVPHSHIIKSLHSIGIKGRLLNWLKDYLTSRYQRVMLDGHLSSSLPVTSGVPQGSILGPLLSLKFNYLPIPDLFSTLTIYFCQSPLITPRTRISFRMT